MKVCFVTTCKIPTSHVFHGGFHTANGKLPTAEARPFVYSQARGLGRRRGKGNQWWGQPGIGVYRAWDLGEEKDKEVQNFPLNRGDNKPRRCEQHF